MSSSYGALAHSADYSRGPFPVLPRAPPASTAVVVSPAAGGGTTVTFVPREPRDKSAPPPPPDVADAERDPVSVAYAGGARAVTVSLGAAAKVDAAGLRKAATAAVAKLRALRVEAATIAIPTVAGIPGAVVAAQVVLAALGSNWAFDRYLTLEDKKAPAVAALTFAVACEEEAAAAGRAAVLAEATLFARDLVNERADEMHPGRLEEVARGVAAAAGAEVFVCAGADLLPAGLHLLHAVGQSSRAAPRYIELTHAGDPEHPSDVLLVVGKGITFDSGGLNIKPTGSMEDMHMDMGGAAAALGAFRAVAGLGLKRNVVVVLAVAENAIGENAFKPHNIIRSHKGLTVEIKNTDAEGRLVLADALSFAQSRRAPHTIIDLATLTGACIVGLGEYAAGQFCNNGAMRAGLAAASEARFERLWPMPIFPEHREEIRAAGMADLQSTGAGRYGGSCTAAAFLENFVGEGVAWAHLDIAGPAMYSRARGHMNAGGTGFGVQVVAEYLLNVRAPRRGAGGGGAWRTVFSLLPAPRTHPLHTPHTHTYPRTFAGARWGPARGREEAVLEVK